MNFANALESPRAVVPRVLLAHPDHEKVRLLRLAIAAGGCDVRVYGTLSDAVKGMTREWIDLFLVDRTLLEQSGDPRFADAWKRYRGASDLVVFSEEESPLAEFPGKETLEFDQVAFNQDLESLVGEISRHLFGTCWHEENAAATSAADLPKVDKARVEIGSESSGQAAETNNSGAQPSGDREWIRLRRRIALLEEERAELRALLRTRPTAPPFNGQTQAAQSSNSASPVGANNRVANGSAPAVASSGAGTDSSNGSSHPVGRLNGDSSSNPPLPPLEKERESLRSWRQRLQEEENRLLQYARDAREAKRQLTKERLAWQEDVQQLKAQEENLKAYEARLRSLVEDGRESNSGFPVPPAATDPGMSASAVGPRNGQLPEDWKRLHRTTEILDAEMANLRDQRLAVQDREKSLRIREEKVRDREIRLSLAEKRDKGRVLAAH